MATMMIAKPPCDTGVILGNPPIAPCSRSTARWVLAATILGSSMAFIDGSAVNVVLPVLQESLRASVTQVQWVIESYMLFLSALILVGGALGDRLGRRRMFVAGIVVFSVASVWCGLAPNATQLIVARALQGVGGALLVPASLAIISASFDDSTRGRAIGTWSGFTAMTMAAGPVLGGWLAESFSWRWVFLINIPIAIVVLAIATRVPESRNEAAAGSIDWLGALLSVVGLGLVVFALVESAHYGLSSPPMLGALAAGAAVLAGFVWVEQRVPNPMMPLGIFRSSTFTGANLLTLLLYGALGGALFFLPFSMIQVHGYTPAQAGAAWLPFVLTVAVLSRWAGGLVPLVGPKLPLVIGPLITAVGFILAAVSGTGGSYWTTFFPAFLIMGLGMAIAVAPLVTVVMDSVDGTQVGVASGVNNAISRAAGLLAVAVMGLIVLASFNAVLDARLAEIGARPELVAFLEAERINLAAAQIPPDATPVEAAALRQAIDQAFVAGFRLVMLVAGGLALASSLVAFWLIGSVRQSTLQVAVET